MEAHILQYLGTVPGGFDSNGDGKPETTEQLMQQYAHFKPEFTRRLRQELGAGAMMLANTAGRANDSALNGVTIEMEACVGATAHQRCINALAEQHAVSHSPPVSVMWLTHSSSMPAAVQCSAVAAIHEQMPWVVGGTDFYDGSHITCK